ncbi:hypothetical protein LWM68_12305 [Niabella sp. W65]|nr:hypothetical protein [Niabella sp. W65]MCH7363456.1 hypothetical protein [Niabella sp. W65]
MKRFKFRLINSGIGFLFVATVLCSISDANGQKAAGSKIAPSKFVHKAAGNPYLPLWEHLPDGEPRVFEDPDNPGKFRPIL